MPRTSTSEDNDVVIFDEDGYASLRDFHAANKNPTCSLTGYATDVCYCETTAGYENLSRISMRVLVGDTSLATFPEQLHSRPPPRRPLVRRVQPAITPVSWVKLEEAEAEAGLTR